MTERGVRVKADRYIMPDLDLLDYRQLVSDLYRMVRLDDDSPAQTCQQFRAQKDDLFRHHAQSPLDAEQKRTFSGLSYYPYDPAFCLSAPVETNIEPAAFDFDLGDDGTFRMRRIGQVHFTLPTGSGSLFLYWIEGYCGGLFLPFKDDTNGSETYGGGRYLYDTIKGADLGATPERLVLDFNYAYHPSCAYHYRWVCPLPPRENTLDFPLPAGECLMHPESP
jgi:uncharacterized protein